MIRITLLRHGRPAFELKGNVRGKDLGVIAKSYDLSGIVGTPPRETVTAVQGNHVVVCSHLVRSFESAKALGCSEVHVKDQLFCETIIPHFGSGSVRVPVGVWIVVLRLLWLFGFSRNGESLNDARRRARKAAERLIELAEEHRMSCLLAMGSLTTSSPRSSRKSVGLDRQSLAKDFGVTGFMSELPLTRHFSRRQAAARHPSAELGVGQNN